jgi:tetratricopeptide (TPR) repeat protein
MDPLSVAASVAGVAALGVGVWQLRVAVLDRRDARRADSGAEGTPEPARVPLVIGDVPREPKAFQPRAELRRQVTEIAAAGGLVVCSLVGSRGVGKTQLAAAYCRYCAGQGVPVAWLNAETVGQLHGSLDLMAAELGLRRENDDSAAVAHKVRAWLEARRDPYVVVFDNAMDADTLAPLLPGRGESRVLITTNDLAFQHLATVVQVERFMVEEARRYLSERVGRTEASTGELIEELDRLPLALSVAAAALVGPPPLGYGAYLERLRSRPIEVLLDRPKGEPYPRGVAQAILFSVDLLSEEAVRLLGELALLSPSGVGLDLLGAEDERPLAELGAGSLVSFDRDGSTVFVHRLVRRVMREKAGRDGTLPSLFEGAARRLELVADIADEDTLRKLPVITTVSMHSAALWEEMEPLLDGTTPLFREAAELLLRIRYVIAEHLVYLNDGDRAAPIAQAVVEGRMQVLGADHPDTLGATYTLAHAHEYSGQPDNAVEIYAELVDRHTRLRGWDDRGTLRARAGLGSALTAAGHAEEAVELLNALVADQHRVLGADHSDLFASRYFQAYAYVMAGRAEEAVALFSALVADRHRVLGGEDPAEELVIRGRLAWAYARVGRLDEATRLYEQVLMAQEQMLGADHPDTLITCHGLAAAHEAAGRINDALALYQRAGERFEAVLGAEQTWTLTALQDRNRLKHLRGPATGGPENDSQKRH